MHEFITRLLQGVSQKKVQAPVDDTSSSAKLYRHPVKTFSFDHVMLNAEHHDLLRSLGTA